MEESNKKELPVLSLQRLSQNISQANNGELSVSVYGGGLTTPAIIESVKRITKAFPQLDKGFYDVFSERMKANNFSDQRLRDAVDYVIDHNVYPCPTIAQFVSFDRRIKLLTYEDMLKKTDEFGETVWNNYKPVKFPNREKLVWVHIDDIREFNIDAEKK